MSKITPQILQAIANGLHETIKEEYPKHTITQYYGVDPTLPLGKQFYPIIRIRKQNHELAILLKTKQIQTIPWNDEHHRMDTKSQIEYYDPQLIEKIHHKIKTYFHTDSRLTTMFSSRYCIDPNELTTHTPQ